MPQLGDILRGNDIGFRTWNKYIWTTCGVCGKERWVMLANPQLLGIPRSKQCVSCMRSKAIRKICGLRGDKSPAWKGGRRIDNKGYVVVWISPDDFFYPMAFHKGNGDKPSYILEHRLVVAKALGRCLYIWEIVHHKHNKYPAGSIEDRQDNRYPENLRLVSKDGHTQISLMEQKIQKLERENARLKREINSLK